MVRPVKTDVEVLKRNDRTARCDADVVVVDKELGGFVQQLEFTGDACDPLRIAGCSCSCDFPHDPLSSAQVTIEVAHARDVLGFDVLCPGAVVDPDIPDSGCRRLHCVDMKPTASVRRIRVYPEHDMRTA
jgi:hypothetical protein